MYFFLSALQTKKSRADKNKLLNFTFFLEKKCEVYFFFLTKENFLFPFLNLLSKKKGEKNSSSKFQLKNRKKTLKNIR